MVIDFHTHIFPDKIAVKTIRYLEKQGQVKAATDGTLAGLLKSMKENGIDISVVMPVVTRPEQFASVNAYSAEINGREGIISFGGIHPDTEDYRGSLEQIKEYGLPGIKLHPDYQKTFVDDPKMVRIIDYATELGLIVLLHAGLDIGLPDPIHCTPQRTRHMLEQIDRPEAKIILAHTGGYQLWDEVEEYLVGQSVCFDISYSLGKISDEQLKRIIENHGADRILFATDSPWDDQGAILKRFKDLCLPKEEEEAILYRNAQNLLALSR
jgi:hypothetical protein